MSYGVDALLVSKRPCRAVGITGGGGALAHYLIEVLARQGVEKIVLFGKKAPSSSPERPEFPLDLSIKTGDILCLDDLGKAFDGCDFIFHLAAQTHVGRSLSEPLECFRVNTMGTANVLEACRIGGIRGVLYTSTVHVYGVPQGSLIREDHPLAPLSIYAASKLAGEMAVQGYRAGLERSLRGRLAEGEGFHG